MIKVIGMGCSAGDITADGKKAIKAAPSVILKTAKCRSAAFLKKSKVAYASLDFIYETAQDFADLNAKIAEYVAKNPNCAFCVDGAGYDDASVAVLAKLAEIEIIPGVSKHAAVARACPSLGATALSATRFLDREINTFIGVLPLFIYEIDDALIAQEVKLKLLNHYDADAEIIFLNAKTEAKIPLAELDRMRVYGYSAACAIPAKPFAERTRQGFSDLLEVIRRLRDPDGCDWDKAQTHRSIRANAIEEACELVEAVDLDDPAKMEEESGDVILQGLFHTVIAEELGEFSTEDAVSALARKLITRHTHIFGTDRAANQDEALKFWDKAKAKEKGYNTVQDKINSVPVTFSALMRAAKIQKIIKKTGFDFPTVEDAYAKLLEEIDELRAAASGTDLEEEGGDLLFAAVNVLRMLGVEPETALNSSTAKFVRRFEYVERAAAAKGKAVQDLPLDELEAFYQEGKAAAREAGVKAPSPR